MSEDHPVDGLDIIDLHCGYGKAVVLRGVNLEVGAGEVVGVAGPNGAGKSTLLRTISGLVSRTHGDIRFNGSSLPTNPVRVCARGVIHVPEGRRLFANLSVAENLHVGAIGAGVRDYQTSRQEVLALFPDVVPLLNRPAGVLSGGQQQFVAVARGLIARPQLLLIDELSLGLSPRAVKEVSTATVNGCRRSGVSVIWVDQNIGLLAEFCDRVLLLAEGTLEKLDIGPESDLGSTYF